MKLSHRTCLFLALLHVCRPLQAEETEFTVRPGRRVLFLENRGVKQLSSVSASVHRPNKRGAVLRSPDPTRTLQTRTAPVWDPTRKKYVLWVLGITPNVWESADGLNWSPLGSTNLPIEMVVYDDRETDRSRRFKSPLRNEGFAVSADGISWTKLDIPKIPSSDEANFSLDRETGLFIHTVKRGGPHGRALAIATSPDFRNWTDLGTVFHADDEDQKRGRDNIAARVADRSLEPLRYVDAVAPNVDIYNMGVFRYEGLFIGLATMFHATGRVPNYPNTDGFDLIELVTSRDLRIWNRVDNRQPFLVPSPTNAGAYDLTQILSPSAPVEHGEELWFYYTGLKYRSMFDYVGTYPNGSVVPLPERSKDAGAVCLAVLRRDGFVSLDAGERTGTAETVPFVLPPGDLHANVDAGRGEFRVEMISSDGRTTVRSRPSSGDSTRLKIDWEGSEPSKLVGQRVSLKFTLRNASLYSYWVGN